MPSATDMKWAAIATWEMSQEGMKLCADMLEKNQNGADAAIAGINIVEDNPGFHSVGYGGRPDCTGRVFLDGGFMDGNTLHFGSVGSIEGFRSPVKIARSLAEGDANNFLIGPGAEQYAEEKGFEKRNNLIPEMKELYEKEKDRLKQLSAYDGHDTVCFCVKDCTDSLYSAVSTSGLFMKRPGRLGDSPVPGAGFYADSKTGCAAATGMGEEIMKGALSFQAVHLMKEGYTAQEAAEKALIDLNNELIERNGYAQAMSIVCLDREGNYGVSTNVPFPFTYAAEGKALTLYKAEYIDGKTVIREIRRHS